MAALPNVDVNLMVYNSVHTIGAVIESILAQSWPAVTLTVIDNCSDDGTLSVLETFARDRPGIRIKRNRYNVGPVANLQRAFWLGDADFIMPKTGDDLIAPTYIERLMGVLLEHPECVMCHAAGQIFTETNQIVHSYPPEHLLAATGTDPVARAQHVMQRYTSAPSFWGVYRRDAVDQLSTLRYRAGMDHVLLAELALYGEIRHVAEPLFQRRGGGKAVLSLARAMTEHGNRGVPLDDMLADQRWRTPLITTAYAHMEAFAVARLPLAQRLRLLGSVPEIFRARWLSLMQREAAQLRRDLPDLLRHIAEVEPIAGACLARSVTEVLLGAQAIMPEEDFTLALLEVAAVCGEVGRPAATQGQQR